MRGSQETSPRQRELEERTSGRDAWERKGSGLGKEAGPGQRQGGGLASVGRTQREEQEGRGGWLQDSKGLTEPGERGYCAAQKVEVGSQPLSPAPRTASGPHAVLQRRFRNHRVGLPRLCTDDFKGESKAVRPRMNDSMGRGWILEAWAQVPWEGAAAR